MFGFKFVDMAAITQQYSLNIGAMRRNFSSRCSPCPRPRGRRASCSWATSSTTRLKGPNMSKLCIHHYHHGQDLFYVSPFYHLVLPYDKFTDLDADIEFKSSPEQG